MNNSENKMIQIEMDYETAGKSSIDSNYITPKIEHYRYLFSVVFITVTLLLRCLF